MVKQSIVELKQNGLIKSDKEKFLKQIVNVGTSRNDTCNLCGEFTTLYDFNSGTTKVTYCSGCMSNDVIDI